ncbi:MAG: hypothetical protein KDE47_12430 [Caldilineaceae bacterium]|nr:hypothetical protein [Caldilineaceae bacterium]
MNNDATQRLRNILAQIYSDSSTIIRVIEDAGIDRSQVNLASSPFNNWHDILRSAAHTGLVNKLLDSALNEYKDNQELHRAVTAYRIEQKRYHEQKVREPTFDNLATVNSAEGYHQPVDTNKQPPSHLSIPPAYSTTTQPWSMTIGLLKDLPLPLQWGGIYIAIGVMSGVIGEAIFVAMTPTDDDVGAFGIIVMAWLATMGLGRLIHWFVSRRDIPFTKLMAGVSFGGVMLGIAIGWVKFIALALLIRWAISCRKLPYAYGWVIASLIGVNLGLVVGAMANAAITDIAPVTIQIGIMGSIIGCVAGSIQWLVLRPIIPQAYWWIVGSVAGNLLGGIVLAIVGHGISEADYTMTIGVMFGIIIGAVAGSVQWLILRQAVRPTYWWIVSNAAGWAIFLAALGTTKDAVHLTNIIVSMVGAGTLYGMVTTFPLLNRFQDPNLGYGRA